MTRGGALWIKEIHFMTLDCELLTVRSGPCGAVFVASPDPGTGSSTLRITLLYVGTSSVCA